MQVENVEHSLGFVENGGGSLEFVPILTDQKTENRRHSKTTLNCYVHKLE